MKSLSITQLIAASPDDVQDAWHDVDAKPRTLFDGLSAEWEAVEIGDKLDVLTALRECPRNASQTLLDAVLNAYLRDAGPDRQRLLAGLGQAVLAYAQEGFDLDLPAHVLIPTGLHAASVSALATLIQRDEVERTHIDWLGREIQRLQHVTTLWITRRRHDNHILSSHGVLRPYCPDATPATSQSFCSPPACDGVDTVSPP